MGPTDLSVVLAGCTQPMAPRYALESWFICTVRHSRDFATAPIRRRHGSRLCTCSQSGN